MTFLAKGAALILSFVIGAIAIQVVGKPKLEKIEPKPKEKAPAHPIDRYNWLLEKIADNYNAYLIETPSPSPQIKKDYESILAEKKEARTGNRVKQIYDQSQVLQQRLKVALDELLRKHKNFLPEYTDRV